MTTRQPGPELDALVSKAIGRNPRSATDEHGTFTRAVRYSTNRALVVPMLEWLAKQPPGLMVHQTVFRSGHTSVRAGGCNAVCRGDTINLALCHAILAVAGKGVV